MVPTGNQMINDQFSTGGPNYREFLYAFVNFAGAAQNFDGNGPYAPRPGRRRPGPGRRTEPRRQPDTLSDQINYAHAIEDPLGTQPQLGEQPPLKPDVRCDTNPVPDVNGPLGQVGPPSPVGRGSEPMSEQTHDAERRAARATSAPGSRGRRAATAKTRSRSSSSRSPAS